MNLLLTSSFYLYAHHPTPLCCSWVIKFTHSSHLINKLLLILEHFCLCSLQTWQNTDLYWKVNHVYFTLSQFIKHCYLVVSFLVYIFANNSVLRLFSKLCWTQQCTWANLCLLLSNTEFLTDLLPSVELSLVRNIHPWSSVFAVQRGSIFTHLTSWSWEPLCQSMMPMGMFHLFTF